jgi:hypothetical protein
MPRDVHKHHAPSKWIIPNFSHERRGQLSSGRPHADQLSCVVVVCNHRRDGQFSLNKCTHLFFVFANVLRRFKKAVSIANSKDENFDADQPI